MICLSMFRYKYFLKWWISYKEILYIQPKTLEFFFYNAQQWSSSEISFERDILMRIFLRVSKNRRNVFLGIYRNCNHLQSVNILENLASRSHEVIHLIFGDALTITRPFEPTQAVRSVSVEPAKGYVCKWLHDGSWNGKIYIVGIIFVIKILITKIIPTCKPLEPRGGICRWLITIINACGWNGFQINCSLLNMC